MTLRFVQDATGGNGSKLLCAVAAHVPGHHARSKRPGQRHLQVCRCLVDSCQRVHWNGTSYPGMATPLWVQDMLHATELFRGAHLHVNRCEWYTVCPHVSGTL